MNNKKVENDIDGGFIQIFRLKSFSNKSDSTSSLQSLRALICSDSDRDKCCPLLDVEVDDFGQLDEMELSGVEDVKDGQEIGGDIGSVSDLLQNNLQDGIETGFPGIQDRVR